MLLTYQGPNLYTSVEEAQAARRKPSMLLTEILAQTEKLLILGSLDQEQLYRQAPRQAEQEDNLIQVVLADLLRDMVSLRRCH